MPLLRFKKDNGQNYKPIKKVVLSDLFYKIRETNKDGKIQNVITNSAEYGLIPQREFFDKDIAVKENTNRYIIINYGDFVYNPRKSSNAPYGPFKCYKRKATGIVSPLYTCLKPKNPDYTEYLLHYFSSPAWYSYIYHNGNQGGARHDRVGMTEDLLKGIPIMLPEKEEQNKIVNFLDLYDELIQNQEYKLKAYENRKDGIISKLFKRELKFNSDDNIEYKQWKYCKLNEVLIERKMKSTGTEEVYSVSVEKGLVNQIEHMGRSFAAEDTSGYKIVFPGDVVYTKSPTGNFKWGIVKQSTIDKNVIISPLYGVFIPKNKELGYILDAYFSSSIRAHNYLITQIRKGAKNTINISNDEFLAKSICLPTDIREQKKICEVINLLNQQVQIEKQKLESMKNVKKGLLQKLFL